MINLDSITSRNNKEHNERYIYIYIYIYIYAPAERCHIL